jgi:TP901 family phage tail tape measure protein
MLAMAERSVTAVFRANVAQYQAAMAQMRQSTRDVSREITKHATENKQAWTQLGVGVGAAGAAIAVALGKSVSMAADFNREVSAVGAVSGATASELQALSKAALAAGADVDLAGVTAAGAAKAQTELARAGLATADILGGALKGSLSLAVAGQLDQARAATLTAQALNVFQLEGADAAHVADVLTAAANKSATTVDQMGDAIRQGGLLAAQTGLSLEETVGTLAAFADNALIGSDAGTSLKTMLQRLSPQSDEAARTMEQLGFSAFDAQGEFVGMEELARRLQAALGDMTDEQRLATMQVLFGSDAVRGANVLYNQGAEGIARYVSAVDDQGAATRMAAAMTDNLRGDLEALGGAIETAMIKAGTDADGVLRALVQSATGVVNTFNELPDGARKAAVAVGGVTSATLLASGGFLIAAPRIVSTRKALADLADVMPRTVGGLRAVGSVLTGPWGVAIAGATAVMLFYVHRKQEAARATEAFVRTLDEETGALTRESRALVVSELAKSGAFEAAERLGISSKDLTDAVLGEGDAYSRVIPIVREYSDVMNGGGPDRQAAVLLTEVIRDQGRVVQDAADMWQLMRDATMGAATAGSAAAWRLAESGMAAATSARSLATGFLEATDGAAELTEQQKTLQSAIDGIRSPMGLYQQLLAEKEAAERKTAEKTAAATKSSADSWETYVKDVDVSLTEYAEALEAKNSATVNWQNNILSIIERGGLELGMAFVALGEEGMEATAQMADAGEEDFQRMAAAMLLNSRLGGEQAVQAMDAQMQLLQRVMTDGSMEAVRRMAAQLKLGTGEVLRIAQQYSAALAAGLNPVILAVGGRPIVVSGGSGAHWRAVESNADGNVYERHEAQIAPAGAWRVWAEPETGGEAYIPLAPSKRQRSRAIAEQTVALLGGVAYFASGGFASVDEVPRPPAYRPGAVGHAASLGSQQMYGDALDWLKANLAPPLAPAAGVANMMAALHTRFPGLQLISGFRPGAITATGNPSYHGMGRAVDIPPRLDVNHWIYDHYKAVTKELINSLPGARQVRNGADHMYSGITRAMHFDHTHWALDQGGFLRPGWNLAYNGTGRPEPVMPPIQGFAGGGLVGHPFAAPFNARTTGGMLAGGRSSADLARAIADVERLVEAWEDAVRAADEAARRDELWARRRAAEAALAKASAQERAAAQREVAESIQAIIDFDRQAARAGEQRAIADQVAAAQARQRIAVNREAFAFDRATVEEQLANLDRRIAAERQFTDEWMRLVQERDRVAERIADRERDRVREAERVRDDAHARLVRLLDEEQRIRGRMDEARARAGVQADQAHQRAAQAQVEATGRRNEQLLRAEQDFNTRVRGVLDARLQQLTSYARIDEVIRRDWGYTARELTDNVHDQIGTFRQWAQRLDQLRAMGLSDDVVAALGLDVGPQALSQVEVLTGATLDEIDALNWAVADRAGVAQQRVARERHGLVGQVGGQLRDLEAEYARSTAAIHEQHAADLARIGGELHAALAAAQEQLHTDLAALSVELSQVGAETGRSFGQALADGLASSLPAVQAAAGQLAGALDAVGAAQARLGAAPGPTGSQVRVGGYVPVRTFDQGGWLQPGWTLAHNGTGAPERVSGGGGVTISIPVSIDARGAQQGVGAEIAAALEQRVWRQLDVALTSAGLK